MKAVVRADPEGKDVKVTEVPIPKPGKNQVLIRVEASPINPSDDYFTQGGYGLKDLIAKPPVIPGFEGSGQIVELGEGAAEHFLNKKVSFINDPHAAGYQGAWAQYIVKPADPHSFIVFDDKVDYAQISSVFVNPVTVVGFLDVIKKGNHKTVIQDAAASSLGKMFIKVCKQANINLINIVRKEEQVEALKKEGATYVLNSSSPDFEETLKKLITEHKPSIYFDAIGGPFPFKVFDLLPRKATLVNYGGLSGQPLSGFVPKNFIFEQKVIRGFWLNDWLEELTKEEIDQAFKFVANDLANGGSIFGTQIVKEYGLDDWKKGLEDYQKVATEGKVLIRPNKN